MDPDQMLLRSIEAPRPSEGVESLYNILSEEQAQEKASAETLLDAISATKVIERESEYLDPEKHWVRTNVWLKAAKSVYESLGDFKRSLKYLTLPGYHALDVRLLYRNRLILPQSDGVFPVAAFETDPSKFGHLSTSPYRFRLLGECAIETSLLDEQDPYYQPLLDLFPFDLVNLDFTTSLTPQGEGPYSGLMKAIDTVLKRQSMKRRGKWALFLTYRTLKSDWNDDTLETLRTNVQHNLDQHPAFQSAFLEKYRVANVKSAWDASQELCISQAVSKWIYDRAHVHSLRVSSTKCVEYRRNPLKTPRYNIFKQVFQFEPGLVSNALPTKGKVTEAWMVTNLVDCVNRHTPTDVTDEILQKEVNQGANVIAALDSDVAALLALAPPLMTAS